MSERALDRLIKLLALCCMVLLPFWIEAQSTGGGGRGTTINATNNAIPKRSNGTTFVDSCWIDDGTNATCSEPIIGKGSGVAIALGGVGGTNPAFRVSSLNVTGFTFGWDVVNGTNASFGGLNAGCFGLSLGTFLSQASAGIAQLGNGNCDATGGLNLSTISASGSAPSASATVGLGYDSTTKTANYNANAGTTSSFSGAWNIVNVTPVTLPGTSTTADQNLITVTIPAGTLNKALRGLRIYAAGVYSTAATSTAQITLKAKLCTVSGCGSGTVLSVCNIQTIALASVTVSGNTWALDCLPITQTAGATASFERSGRLSIDLGSLTTAADSIFLDPAANATLGTIDTTAQLFLQVSIAFSAASASNVATQRQLVAETVN